MALPIITRGFGIRDDYVDASLSTLNSASVTTNTFTSDGDILTWNVTMANPSNGDVAVIYRAVSGPDPSKYSAATVRCNVTAWPSSNFQLRQWVASTPSGTTDTGQNSLANTSNLNQYLATNFPLTNERGLTINTINGLGQWTNTYTADQWWYILTGLVHETGTVQADGNPTWQWFQSDQIQAKVLPTDWLPQEPMGRVQFWDYALQLKKFDILPETIPIDVGPGPGGISY